MEDTPPKPIEAQEPERDFINLRMIERSLKNLARALSVLEGGVRSFSQLDPHEASTGFNVARGDLEKFRKSVIETRRVLEQFFQVTDSMPLLENPPPIALTTNRNPDSTLVIARRLISGFTGCRNAINDLLKHEQRLLKKGVLGNDLGKENLNRLATLSPVLSHFEFGTSDEAKISLIAIKPTNPSSVIIPMEPRRRRTKPIAPEKVVALRTQFEEKKGLFGSELAYDLAQEICMQMEDCGRGFPFEELRELFGLTNHNLKKELEFLRLIVKSFNVTLAGSFEPRGRPLIAFETEHQQEPSTQSMK